MFDQKALETLQPGDVIEMGKLFPGVSKEPIVFQLIEVTPKNICRNNVWLFAASWFGVDVGMYRATKKSGLIKMTEAKT